MAQLAETKLFNKGMNKDVDPRFLGEGEYIDALNAMPSNYQDGAVNSLTNFPAIQLRQSYSATGYTVLGTFKDEHEDKLYVFAVNSTTRRIYKYDLQTNTQSTVLSTTALPWTTATVIKACSIVEDIIIWTDGDNEIGMYDQNVTYGTITSDMLTLAQVVPLTEPKITLVSDTVYKSNNITGKFFQFKYRFVFKNKMRSTFSPISNVAYSSDDYSAPSSLSGKDNLINCIDVSMSGAHSNGLVESIEIAARSGNNGDFYLIKKIDVDSTFLSGGEQVYRFYNEGLYDPIALKESNQLFDDVPRTAQTLEFANNRVVTGDNKNGYDDVAVDYDIEVIYNDAVSPTIQREDTDLVSPTNTRYGMNNSSEFSSFMNSEYGLSAPLAGDVITCAGKSVITGGVPNDYYYPFGSVSVQAEYGDSWADIWDKLTTPYFWHPEPMAYMRIHDINTNTAPNVTGNDAFIITLTQGAHSKTFKTGAWYNVGLQYFDKYGRTNGVQLQEDSKVYIKTLGERGLTQDDYTGAGAATIKVTINNSMPSWAVAVKVVYSRASVYDQSIQVATRGAQANADSSINVDLDIGSIVEWNEEKGGNLAYIWEKGDRIRVITYNNGGTILTDWAQELLEAEIVAADPVGGVTTGGYAITIPKFDGYTQAAMATLLGSGAIIEIFRPSRQLEASQSIFTEANFIEGSTDTISGDAYLKSREDFPYGTGSATANIAFEGYDISDFNDSEHYDKGRPTAIINQQESQRYATLMYSEVIIPNTEINQLNRFYPDVNYEEYNKSFGKIILLHNEGDHLLMIQEDKASKVFVDRSLMYDGAGNATLLNTQQRVLSEAVPYLGVYGIQDHRSFASIGNRRYWLDMARGVVIRLSNNGIEEISRYGMRGWFSDMCKTRMAGGNLATYGAYDVQNDMYIIYFGTGNSVVFDEKNNSWITFTDVVLPAFSTYINNRSFVIYANGLYEMNYPGLKNTIYTGGSDPVKYTTVTFPSNAEPQMLKNYLAMLLDSNYAMNVTIETDVINGGTNQQSSLVVADFIQREQEWHAAFLRDANTPNVTYPIISGDTMKGKHAVIQLSLQTDEDLLIRMAQIVVSKG